jgi:hypothetical protein
MTTAGWIFMLGSIGGVTILMLWCFHRVLTRPEVTERMEAPLSMDLPDKERY